MTSEQYNRLTSNIRNNKSLIRFLNVADKSITYSTVVLYGGFLIYLFLNDTSILLRSILVPLVCFVAVSIFRRFNHSKRPYEVLDIEPLIKKDTVEKSFPSRHVFSIFMISMTFLQVSLQAALILAALGIVLACLRVIGGVHFPKDVVAGMLIGILGGFVGYGLIFR